MKLSWKKRKRDWGKNKLMDVEGNDESFVAFVRWCDNSQEYRWSIQTWRSLRWGYQREEQILVVPFWINSMSPCRCASLVVITVCPSNKRGVFSVHFYLKALAFWLIDAGHNSFCWQYVDRFQLLRWRVEHIDHLMVACTISTVASWGAPSFWAVLQKYCWKDNHVVEFSRHSRQIHAQYDSSLFGSQHHFAASTWKEKSNVMPNYFMLHDLNQISVLILLKQKFVDVTMKSLKNLSVLSTLLWALMLLQIEFTFCLPFLITEWMNSFYVKSVEQLVFDQLRLLLTVKTFDVTW